MAPHHEKPEAWLVEGGIAQVAQSQVEELADKLRISSPVEVIRQEAGGAEGSFASGERLGAAAVVVAEPPLWLGIRFTPAMVPELQALSQPPFWRERGLDGLAIGNLTVLELTVNSSPPDGPGLLAGFIAAARAGRWQRLPEAERRRAVLGDLITLWWPQADEPEERVLHNWNQEPGAFTSFFTPSAWTHRWRRLPVSPGRVVYGPTRRWLAVGRVISRARLRPVSQRLSKVRELVG